VKKIVLIAAFLGAVLPSARFAAAQGLCTLGAKKGFEFAKQRLASPERFEPCRTSSSACPPGR